MMVAFSISPSGGDETGGVSEAVAAAIRVVRESGLPNETNAMFTKISAGWNVSARRNSRVYAGHRPFRHCETMSNGSTIGVK